MLTETEKSRQRRAANIARRSLLPAQRAEASQRICRALLAEPALAAAHTVLVYRAFPFEADCAAYCRAAAVRGTVFAWPYCLSLGRMEARLAEPDAVFQNDRCGIPAPPDSARRVLPGALDAVIVPMAAFDAQCGRVGMGGGFYDRYLPQCRGAVKIGIAFEVQQVRHADCTALDFPLDLILTEQARYLRRP